MMEIPDKVRRFRERYRRTEVGANYNGWVHFGFTTILSLGVIGLSVTMLDDPRPIEWLTVPLTLLYANLSEYLGHRGPMHHPFPGLGLVFRRHSGQHHRFFTDVAMEYEGSHDFKAVLFPPVLIVFFLLAFATPVGLLLSWLFSANVCWLFVATAVAYFLNYELFHWAYHQSAGSLLRRLPGLDRLRRLHLRHHDPRFMQTHNFNITYPLGDWLFGTWYRERDGRKDAREALSRRPRGGHRGKDADYR